MFVLGKRSKYGKNGSGTLVPQYLLKVTWLMLLIKSKPTWKTFIQDPFSWIFVDRRTLSSSISVRSSVCLDVSPTQNLHIFCIFYATNSTTHHQGRPRTPLLPAFSVSCCSSASHRITAAPWLRPPTFNPPHLLPGALVWLKPECFKWKQTERNIRSSKEKKRWGQQRDKCREEACDGSMGSMFCSPFWPPAVSQQFQRR